MVPQVSHFLLVFDRAHSHLISEQRFDDHRQALEERFRAERMHRANPDIEVVVLSAESKDALRLTHARYFQSVSLLASVKKATTSTAVRQREHRQP
jgi:spore cortex formation protein SpoVR/YcgB (stage V sporulation)